VVALSLGGRLKAEAAGADSARMGRSVIGICALVGMTIGGFVPELWGASGLSLAALVFSAAGGVAGVWVGARLSEA